MSVVGIGPVKALELYNNNVCSVIDLKNKIKNKQINVDNKIKLGLNYYNKFEGNIPRKKIDYINIIFKNIIDKLNETLDENNIYIYEIAGSFRRMKDTSNDIDVIISKKGKLNSNYNYLENIVSILKDPIKKNDNKKLIIDDMTDKSYSTKYMGFIKYKNNKPWRLDIRFVPYKNYFCTLTYFTGSKEFNVKMRNIAIKKGYKLNEYNLINIITICKITFYLS